MASTAGAVPSGAAAAGPPAKTGMTRERRGAGISPFFMMLGTLLWLIGSALFVGSQPRYNVVLVPPTALGQLPTAASSAVRTGGDWTGAWVCWIIASCFWILAALGHLLHAFGTAAAVTVAGKRPGIAAWTLVAAWMQLIATVIVLIGSCIFAGGTLGAVSAGAVLLLIGFTIWGHAVLIQFGVSYVISTVAVLMPDFRQRQYAWSAITSLLFLLVQFILYNLASVLLVVRDPPGIWLTAGLLYLIGSIYGMFGWTAGMRGLGFYSPIMGFATAAYSTPGVMAAVGGGAVAGAATGAAMHENPMKPTPAVAAGPATGAAAAVPPAGTSMATAPVGATPESAAPQVAV